MAMRLPKRNSQKENAFSRGNATSGEPICSGMIRLPKAKNNGVANISSITVPCIVNSWLYCSGDRNCRPGRPSSARISIAMMPPAMKKTNDVTRYISPMVLWSVVRRMLDSREPLTGMCAGLGRLTIGCGAIAVMTGPPGPAGGSSRTSPAGWPRRCRTWAAPTGPRALTASTQPARRSGTSSGPVIVAHRAGGGNPVGGAFRRPGVGRGDPGARCRPPRRPARPGRRRASPASTPPAVGQPAADLAVEPLAGGERGRAGGARGTSCPNGPAGVAQHDPAAGPPVACRRAPPRPRRPRAPRRRRRRPPLVPASGSTKSCAARSAGSPSAFPRPGNGGQRALHDRVPSSPWWLFSLPSDPASVLRRAGGDQVRPAAAPPRSAGSSTGAAAAALALRRVRFSTNLASWESSTLTMM